MNYSLLIKEVLQLNQIIINNYLQNAKRMLLGIQMVIMGSLQFQNWTFLRILLKIKKEKVNSRSQRKHINNKEAIIYWKRSVTIFLNTQKIQIKIRMQKFLLSIIFNQKFITNILKKKKEKIHFNNKIYAIKNIKCL